MDQIGRRFLGYFGKMLILAGMVLVFGSFGVFLSNILTKLFLGIDLSTIDFSAIKKEDVQMIAALKLYQTIGGGIGMFLVPALLFPAAIKYPIHVMFMNKNRIDVKSLFVGVLSIILVTPLISWLYQLNQQMNFPESWKEWEISIKNMEAQAELLTNLFVSADTYPMLLLNIFVVALVPAICEELFFRGIILQYTRFIFDKEWIAVVVSAIVFSGFHGQFYGFIPRFVLGVLLGYLFLNSANIFLPILAHFINNALAVLAVFYQKELAVFEVFTPDYQFAWYWVVLSALLSIAAVWYINNTLLHALLNQSKNKLSQ